MSEEENNIISNVKKSGKKKKKISSPVAFGLLSLVLLYFIITIGANVYMDSRGDGEENGMFHEILSLVFILVIGFIGYFKIFNKKIAIAQKKSDEAAINSKKKEKELKDRFNNGYKLLKNSKEPGSIIDGIHRLIRVALEDISRRQSIVNYLDGVNQWMAEERAFLTKQNLIAWRLKAEFFDQIDHDKQRISMEALSGLEKIIKQHATEFKERKTDVMLDLSSKYIPALNLGSIQLLPGSIVLDFAFLWQTSFWQGQILDISFVSTELQGANFWRCYLEQIDFGGANLKNAKLKTNLKEVKNLSPAQFFSTQEWSINILKKEQIDKFFPEQSDKNSAWSKWMESEEERILLESTINKPEWI